MRAAEILRNLANIIDAADSNKETPNQVKLVKVNSELPGEKEPTPQSSEPMIPPLQQKLELMKKSVGVDSAFDDDPADDLEIIKKTAGIGNTCASSNDEDLE